jgi:hypothetical protein
MWRDEAMRTEGFRRPGIAGGVAVALALYWLGMSWSLHRQRQAQAHEYTLLLKKIEGAREKRQQLQALIEKRRSEILLRRKGGNSPGDFWMPGEFDRLRMKRNAHHQG